MTLFFQKSVIALSCLLVVAAAQKPSSYYYSTHPEQPRSYHSVPYVEKVPKTYTYSTPVKRQSSPNGVPNVDFSTILADFGAIAQYINDPYYALEKAQGLLEDLNSELPEALARMDPAIKSDIKEVNNLILEICDKAVANARPSSTTSYYSPEAMKSTCAFIQKHVPSVSQGLDDPAVISNIIGKLGEFGRLSKQMADLFE